MTTGLAQGLLEGCTMSLSYICFNCHATSCWTAKGILLGTCFLGAASPVSIWSVTPRSLSSKQNVWWWSVKNDNRFSFSSGLMASGSGISSCSFCLWRVASSSFTLIFWLKYLTGVPGYWCSPPRQQRSLLPMEYCSGLHTEQPMGWWS